VIITIYGRMCYAISAHLQSLRLISDYYHIWTYVLCYLRAPPVAQTLDEGRDRLTASVAVTELPMLVMAPGEELPAV